VNTQPVEQFGGHDPHRERPLRHERLVVISAQLFATGLLCRIARLSVLKTPTRCAESPDSLASGPAGRSSSE
jgi:hypothetical protein